MKLGHDTSHDHHTPLSLFLYCEQLSFSYIWLIDNHLLHSRLYNNHGALAASEKPCVFITCKLSDSWIQQIKKNVWKLLISTNKKKLLKMKKRKATKMWGQGHEGKCYLRGLAQRPNLHPKPGPKKCCVEPGLPVIHHSGDWQHVPKW